MPGRAFNHIFWFLSNVWLFVAREYDINSRLLKTILALCFYLTLVVFLKMFSAVLLSMLMILPRPQNVLGHMICSNNMSLLLNWNATPKTR